MRLLIPVLILLLVAISAPSTEAARPEPPKAIEAYLVVPEGETLTAAMQAEVERWVQVVEAWYEEESGRQITVNFAVIRPNKSIAEMSRPSDLDACGDGLHWPLFFQTTQSMGIGAPSSGTRLWFIVIGAGGWAGGLYSKQSDYGWAIVGDWALYEALHNGELHPCDVSGGVTGDASRPFGHETGHAMGLGDIHSPTVLWTGDPWSREHRRNFLRNNREFY